MSVEEFLHETMGMPAYLLHEHVDLVADGAAEEWTPNYLEQRLEKYFVDDLHISAAVIALHPLLDKRAVDTIYGLLESPAEAGTVLELDKHGDEERVHLLLEGRMRLVAYANEKRAVEIGQCRPGQLIGLSSALRAFDGRSAETQWKRPADVVIKAIPIGKVATQSIRLAELVTAMQEHATVRRFVRHHVSVRFARRTEFFDKLRKNPILQLLSPANQEYLLQLGAVRGVKRSNRPNAPSTLYLGADKPSNRAALVISGNCSAFLPGTPEQYVGNFGPMDLVGHEKMVMPEELLDIDAAVDIVENPRTTNVYATADCQVLEFFWHALRWTLDDRLWVWARIVDHMVKNQHVRVMPQIVCIQAACPRLGTTLLTHGIAATLAATSDGRVCIVDLQASHNFDSDYGSRGFRHETKTHKLQVASRAQRAAGRGDVSVEYQSLVPPPKGHSSFEWPDNVEMVWPTDTGVASKAELLVEAMSSRTDLQFILVCVERDAEHSDETARELAILLNERSQAVLYVTDETERGYLFSDIEPLHMTWIERMTPAYLVREKARERQATNEALLGGWLRWLPTSWSDKITRALGGLPDDNARVDFEYRRKVVRVPEDPKGARLCNARGPMALVGDQAPNLPLKRAFARLARVITRQTVGLALGGGGAWGYSHIPLIRNLEAHGVPIDYITGTSFGSIVGGLYAAGGSTALERLIEENSIDIKSSIAIVPAMVVTPLMHMLLIMPITSAAIEWFVNTHLRRMGLNGGHPIGLGTTEIPFYPIGSNLTAYRELAEEHATIGHGARLSGTMPPIAAANQRNRQLIVDGAFVANVPSRYLREIGVDFVIAANAVPPAPAKIANDIAGRIISMALARFIDAMRANQLSTWKGGEDQASLYANYRVDMQPKNADFYEMWKGRTITQQIEHDHFSGAKAQVISNLWDTFRNAPIDRNERSETMPESIGGDRVVKRNWSRKLS